MRRLAFTLAMMASVFIVLAWAAGLNWRAPLSAQNRQAFEGAQLKPVMGGATGVGGFLTIDSLGEQATALQSVALDGIEASEYPFLRYRFSGFPQTLELSLVFRRADSVDDVRVISLPWPGTGDASFDLSSVPDWRGRIVELGFAEYPTPQLVPATQPFSPFALEALALESSSWQGDFAALATDWLGYWPWSQRSVHALGRDTDTPRARSLVLCIALIVASSILWGTWLLRWRGRRRLVFAAAVLAAGWLLLDLQWHAGLHWRNQTTRTLYADLAWPDREAHAADSEIVAVANEIKPVLAKEPDTTRILIHAGTSYEQLRLAYHLLPFNVAILAQVIEHASKPVPECSLIVVYNTEGWEFDASGTRLRGGGLEWPAVPVAQGRHWIIARVGGGPR